MKLLILGGTQFFGKDIVRVFKTLGWEVGVFTRGNERPSDLPSVLHIQGDRDLFTDLKGAAQAQPWDAVIDNIAFNADHVNNALEAFSQVPRYVLTSTVSVYKYAPKKHLQPIREEAVDFDFTPEEEDLEDVHWQYARGKLEAEKAVLASSHAGWTILRPPVVYGPYDPTRRGFWYLDRILQDAPIPLADGGNHSFRFNYSLDLAKAFYSVLRTDKSRCQIYNTANPEVLTVRNFVELSAEALGKKTEIISVPREYLKDLAGPYDAPVMINFIPSLDKIHGELEYHTTPLESFLRSTAVWYRDRAVAAKIDEARDRELELINDWKKLIS